MSVALMFAARHLARYLTVAARASEWQCTLSTRRRVYRERERSAIHSRHTHTNVHRHVYTYASSPEDHTRRVELRAVAPLVLSYSTARLDTRHDSARVPLETLPPSLSSFFSTPLGPSVLARTFRPPANDTVCKQRKNATRLFPLSLLPHDTNRCWPSEVVVVVGLVMEKVAKRDKHSWLMLTADGALKASYV